VRQCTAVRRVSEEYAQREAHTASPRAGWWSWSSARSRVWRSQPC